MFLISAVASGVGRKAMIYGGIALAVLLVVCGLYRAGGRAASAAAERRAHQRAEKANERISQAEVEIARAGSSPDAAREWLRNRANRGRR